jgi:hypothetical protein
MTCRIAEFGIVKCVVGPTWVTILTYSINKQYTKPVSNVELKDSVLNVIFEDNSIENIQLPVCSVCLELFSETNAQVQLKCNHIFCDKCVNKIDQNCPICRQSTVNNHIHIGNDIEVIQQRKKNCNYCSVNTPRQSFFSRTVRRTIDLSRIYTVHTPRTDIVQNAPVSSYQRTTASIYYYPIIKY